MSVIIRHSPSMIVDLTPDFLTPDFLFTGTRPSLSHASIVTAVREEDGVKWYRFSGAHNSDSDSGEMRSSKSEATWISEVSNGASERNGKLLKWKSREKGHETELAVVRGYNGLRGFGKAGR